MVKKEIRRDLIERKKLRKKTKVRHRCLCLCLTVIITTPIKTHIFNYFPFVSSFFFPNSESHGFHFHSKSQLPRSNPIQSIPFYSSVSLFSNSFFDFFSFIFRPFYSIIINLSITCGKSDPLGFSLRSLCYSTFQPFGLVFKTLKQTFLIFS